MRPNPNGLKARCGGPVLCLDCAREAVTVAVNDDLLYSQLLECHRPVLRPDTAAHTVQYQVQCPACDRNHWKIWQPGDADVFSCELWRAARARFGGPGWDFRRRV